MVKNLLFSSFSCILLVLTTEELCLIQDGQAVTHEFRRPSIVMAWIPTVPGPSSQAMILASLREG